MGNSNFSSKEAVALIGYGYWGKKLYKYLKEHPGFDLVNVYFPSLQKYEQLEIQSKWGQEFTKDLGRIWQDRSIQCIVVATPISTHYDLVKEALSRGKDVLCEKPLTMDAQLTSELAELALEQASVLETEYTYTYSKALERVLTLIAEGAIGKLKSINISFQQLGRFLPYDVLLLLGSHALSILDMFISLDELSFEVFPIMVANNVTTSASIHYYRKPDLNFHGSIDLSLHSPETNKKVIFFGETGTIQYDPAPKESLNLTKFNPRQTALGKVDILEQKSFSFDEGHNLRFAIDHFYKSVTDSHESNIDRALRINKVLDALREQASQV